MKLAPSVIYYVYMLTNMHIFPIALTNFLVSTLNLLTALTVAEHLLCPSIVLST